MALSYGKRPSQADILMLNRVDKKILRNIQSLPVRCPQSEAVTSLNYIGSCDIGRLIELQQLAFINSIINMQEASSQCGKIYLLQTIYPTLIL